MKPTLLSGLALSALVLTTSCANARNCPDATMGNLGLLTTAFCLAVQDPDFQAEIDRLPVPNTPKNQASFSSMDALRKKFRTGAGISFQDQVRGSACVYTLALASDGIESGGMIEDYLGKTVHDGLAQHVSREMFTQRGLQAICTGSFKIDSWQPFGHDWKKQPNPRLPRFPVPQG